jgi:hypothetical protein
LPIGKKIYLHVIGLYKLIEDKNWGGQRGKIGYLDVPNGR